MSRPHDGHRPFFPFGNPFRMILPKGSYASPKLRSLLHDFEETLAERFKKLKPKDNSEVLSLSWMILAMESLCQTHEDMKTLITELQFPVSHWDEKWMDTYLDNSVKLLDICISFSSEVSRLNQGRLLLQYIQHILNFSSSSPSAEQLVQASSSLHDWMHQTNSKNPKLENCSAVLHGMTGSLYLAKFKNSAKGKVLMRAMYGVRVQTIFICSILTAAFLSSTKPLIDLNFSDKFLWSGSFNDLQATVNGEIRRLHGAVTVLKELEAVHRCVEKLYSLTEGVGHKDAEILQKSSLSLHENMEKFTQGLDLLSKQVENFFQIVLTGRDAMLCNLRIPSLERENNNQEQLSK